MPRARACRTARSPRPVATWIRRAPTRGQSGFGLPEVLVTIILAGLVVLGLASGLLTLVRTTESNERRQQVQLALGNFSEGVRAMDYLDCTTSPDGASADEYQQAYDAVPANWQPETTGPLAGMSARIVDVAYWTPTGRTFAASCAATDHGAQQLTLEVTWRDRTDRAQIVIGDR